MDEVAGNSYSWYKIRTSASYRLILAEDTSFFFINQMKWDLHLLGLIFDVKSFGTALRDFLLIKS